MPSSNEEDMEAEAVPEEGMEEASVSAQLEADEADVEMTDANEEGNHVAAADEDDSAMNGDAEGIPSGVDEGVENNADDAEEQATDADEHAPHADSSEAANMCDGDNVDNSGTTKVEEEPMEGERETDAPSDERPRVARGSVGLSFADATLNAMPTAGGRLIMTLSEGGFQYLLAGIRATTGVKAGRYMFEVKIVEALNPAEPQGSQGRSPQPRQLVRVGVSLAGSSLFLADTPDSVCFDSEGFFTHGRKKTKAGQKFGKDHTVAVLLNLDPGSVNANTISMFRNGERVSEPQAIPEHLRGKVLFPTITFRNVTLHAHFGSIPRVALPFKCRMLGDAAEADVELASAATPADGKYEVLFPVGMPERGYFDWVDRFIEKNPGYTELSDRMIVDWATKSGVWRPKNDTPNSKDRPDIKFGIPLMDNLSVRKVLAAVAPTLRRNFIIPELTSNLLLADRQKALALFDSPEFKRTAVILMGEPTDDYKAKVHELILAEKTAKAEVEKAKKAQADERKRMLEEKKRKAEEAKRMREAKDSQKRKAGSALEAEPEEKELDTLQDTKLETDEGKDVRVELSEAEKNAWHRKSAVPDIAEQQLLKAYAAFSLPTKDEGFDSITHEWQPEDASTKHFREWVLEMKRTQRVDDLKPGSWFKENWSKWQKMLQEWRKRQAEWKDPVKRKALQSKRKAGESEDGEAEDADGEAKEFNAEDIEVDTVEDVMDLGNGEPLFANFLFEDWSLVSIRVELHLLIHAFRKDLDDPDRPSFPEAHLCTYYKIYFRKSFNLKTYNVEKFEDFIELIKDTVVVDDEDGHGLFKAMCNEDISVTDFVKVTEENRRDRQRRIDAGDETAKLKFNRPAPPPPKQQPTAQGTTGASGAGGASGGDRSARTRPPQPGSRDGTRTTASTASRGGGGVSGPLSHARHEGGSSSTARSATGSAVSGRAHASSAVSSRTGIGASSGDSSARSRASSGLSASYSSAGAARPSAGNPVREPSASYSSSASRTASSGGGSSSSRAPPPLSYSSRTAPPPAYSAGSAGQKRAYSASSAPSSYPASTRPRLASHGSSGGYGGSSSGSYYRR